MAKKVENKKIALLIDGYADGVLKEISLETTYFELIYGACKRPSDPQSGFTWDDIENINRVKDYYDASKDKDIISIDDADLNFIIERVKTNKWNSMDKKLLDFKKYIEGLVK